MIVHKDPWGAILQVGDHVIYSTPYGLGKGVILKVTRYGVSVTLECPNDWSPKTVRRHPVDVYKLPEGESE